MSKQVLDYSENYLMIFSRELEIDKNLPKWKEIETQRSKEEKAAQQYIQGDPEFDTKIPTKSETKKIEESLERELSFTDLTKMNTKEFNIFVSKRILLKTFKNYSLTNELTFNDNTAWAGSKPKRMNFIERIVQYFITWKDTHIREEAVEFDVISFFDQIKNLSKDESIKYIDRIKPYMIALKQSNEMGQQALSDKLVSEIFKNKYESLLYAGGFYHKITEEQAVYFIKRAEKGIRIDYIKNFARPIPDEVQEKKRQADKLMVFDNYMVMHYDPELKSFKQTKEEEEAYRRRRMDPILFGVIYGSRDLYYIADWVDDYCDLTLDQFVDVAGFDKKALEISETIKF